MFSAAFQAAHCLGHFSGWRGNPPPGSTAVPIQASTQADTAGTDLLHRERELSGHFAASLLGGRLGFLPPHCATPPGILPLVPCCWAGFLQARHPHAASLHMVLPSVQTTHYAAGLSQTLGPRPLLPQDLRFPKHPNFSSPHYFWACCCHQAEKLRLLGRRHFGTAQPLGLPFRLGSASIPLTCSSSSSTSPVGMDVDGLLHASVLLSWADRMSCTEAWLLLWHHLSHPWRAGSCWLQALGPQAQLGIDTPASLSNTLKHQFHRSISGLHAHYTVKLDTHGDAGPLAQALRRPQPLKRALSFWALGGRPPSPFLLNLGPI